MSVARVDTLRSKLYSAITNSYTALGTPLTHTWRIYEIVNNTDGDMLFSFNAATDNLFVPAFSFALYDLSTNAPPINVSDNLVLGIGTQISIKYASVPTQGSVYLSGTYALGE